MRKLKGFTLIELLIVVAIIAILAAIAIPNFLEAQTRSKVARVQSDQRTLSTGIETYYVDNNTYPKYTKGGALPDDMYHINAFAGPTSGAFEIPSFRLNNFNDPGGLNHTLTTPISYVTTIPRDPFASTKRASFGYYSDQSGWILISFGPDADEGDTPPGDLMDYAETVYFSSISQPSLTLICLGAGSGSFTYDPTNGTSSTGDLYRVMGQ